MGCCSCGTVVRYKKLVNNVFPDDYADGNPEQDQLIKITEFALSNTDKLNKIASYLQSRIVADLERRHLGHVQVGMIAFQDLMLKCHEQLTLFVAPIMHLIQLLLDDVDPTVHSVAVATLDRFSDVQNGFYSMLTGSLSEINRNLIDACVAALDKEQTLLAGTYMRGIYAVVRAAPESLDANLQQSLDEMITVVMRVLVLSSTDDEDEDEDGAKGKQKGRKGAKGAKGGNSTGGAGVGSTEEVELDDLALTEGQEDGVLLEDVQELARELLTSLASRSASDSASGIMDSLFSFLDAEEGRLWNEFAFANEVVYMVTTSLPSNFASIAYSSLLDHLQATQDVGIKTAIARMLGELLSQAFDSLGMATHHLGSTMLDTLDLSMDAMHQAKARDQEEEAQMYMELQEQTTRVMQLFASNQQYTEQKIETALQVLTHMQGAEASGDSLQQGDAIAYLQCMKQILGEVEAPLPSSNVVPTTVMSPLLRLASAGDTQVRVVALEVIREVVARSVEPEKLHTIKRRNSFRNAGAGEGSRGSGSGKGRGGRGTGKGKGKSGTSSRSTRNKHTRGDKSQGARFLKLHGASVHEALLASAVHMDNEPANFEAIHNCMCAVLHNCGLASMELGVPTVFRLQKLAASRDKQLQGGGSKRGGGGQEDDDGEEELDGGGDASTGDDARGGGGMSELDTEENRMGVLLNRSVHSLVGAYLTALCEYLQATDASEYVVSIMQQRAENQELCAWLDVSEAGEMSLNGSEYADTSVEFADVAHPVRHFFDLAPLANHLQTCAVVKQHYENQDLATVLQQFTPAGTSGSGASSGSGSSAAGGRMAGLGAGSSGAAMLAGASMAAGTGLEGTRVSTVFVASPLMSADDGGNGGGSMTPILPRLDASKVPLRKRHASTLNSMRSMRRIQEQLRNVEKEQQISGQGGAHHMRAIFSAGEGEHRRPALHNLEYMSTNYGGVCGDVHTKLEERESKVQQAMSLLEAMETELEEEAEEESRMAPKVNMDATGANAPQTEDSTSLRAVARAVENMVSPSSSLRMQFPAFGLADAGLMRRERVLPVSMSSGGVR